MNEAEARTYLRQNHYGVLATIKRGGRPQLSNVLYLLDDDGEIKISVTQDRAKTHNARRDPRVSLAVVGDNFFQYVVAEGTARLIEDDPLPLLRQVYRGVQGREHPNWREFDEAMVRDRRLVLAIRIDRLYPLTSEAD